MHFQIANCNIIVESLLAVLDAWKELTAHTHLSDFAFSHFDLLKDEESLKEKSEKEVDCSKKMLMETFIYLVDFVMMRKLV
jgi:hypothetical protein